MILSYAHRFIFIKTVKTAGTSIEVFLGRHCGQRDVVTPVIPPEAGHRPQNHRRLFNPLEELRRLPLTGPWGASKVSTLKQFLLARRFQNHMTAFQVRSRVPAEVWQTSFRFTVERNPFDKTLSYFHMLRTRGDVRDLDELFDQGLLPTDWHRYTDLDGTLLVDRVLRYEQLENDLGEVCRDLGIDWPGQLNASAKRGSRDPATSWRDELTPSHRRQIETAFARELDAFGYEW